MPLKMPRDGIELTLFKMTAERPIKYHGRMMETIKFRIEEIRIKGELRAILALWSVYTITAPVYLIV